MKIYKPNFWNSINILSVLLLPVTLIVILIICIKKKIIKPSKFKIPIICVGNIYIGGTGKTPLSILLAKELMKNSKQTAIVRKYYKQHLDEHLFLRDKFENFFLNKNRINGILEAINKGCEVAILDDGFQDYNIRKDLNIICFHQTQKVGNGLVLPSGPLRENLNALKNAQIVVINGDVDENFEKKILDINKNLSIFYTKYVPINIERLKNKKLFAIAGIGNPENFFQILSNNNLEVSKKIVFPDHYKFKKSEILDIIKMAKNNDCKLIMTEKDYFRIKEFNLEEIEFLKVELEIKNKDQLIKKIFENI